MFGNGEAIVIAAAVAALGQILAALISARGKRRR